MVSNRGRAPSKPLVAQCFTQSMAIRGAKVALSLVGYTRHSVTSFEKGTLAIEILLSSTLIWRNVMGATDFGAHFENHRHPTTT